MGERENTESRVDSLEENRREEVKCFKLELAENGGIAQDAL